MKITKYIPSTITAMNLSLGFIAILLNSPQYSPWLILAGAIFDVFDGAVARKLNVTSKFGGELDSLADIVTFGVAPAYLYYHHILQYSPVVTSIVVTVILVVFGGLRLAKYNVKTEKSDNFSGVPIPTSGLFFAFLVYEVHNGSVLDFEEYKIIWLSLPIIFALLMVSPFTFFSLKNSDSHKKNILLKLIIIIFIITAVLMIIYKLPTIPLAFSLYILISLFFCRKGC